MADLALAFALDLGFAAALALAFGFCFFDWGFVEEVLALLSSSLLNRHGTILHLTNSSIIRFPPFHSLEPESAQRF